MRVQGIHDGTVYASDGRDVLVRGEGGRYDAVGRLPSPEGLAQRALVSRRLRRLSTRVVGAVSTVNVWPLSATDLLATLGSRLLVSGDGGKRWTVSRRLPASSGPMGVLPPAVAHHEGTTYLGEYPLESGTTPRILASSDRGHSWRTAVSLPDVRHVHAVQRDPYTDDVWVTTGDTDAESRIGRLRDGEFAAVGGGSQEWRAVELAFTPSSVVWGMDCAYADVNRIFRLPRQQVGAADPAPQPIHAVEGSVYYAATLGVDGATWVVLSTAMEAGRDRTGPAGQRENARRGVVVAASSATGFTDWHELAAFERASCLADRLPGWLPRANGYVYLAADPDLGLLLNPYNTASGHGSIRRIPPGALRRSSDSRPASGRSANRAEAG